MLSIVLYGRNDNYGYNLHKRAALSLNCMAEVLTDPADEILFVDYNTPDDYPTFPEAIQDTLTKRAREILRILRVRPRIHERFRPMTRLMALEPIARNVAVRRSSPSSRWILSTNTDMIFVPQQTSSLSEIVRGLAPGFYHAPRMEIPEALWESFDRHAPTNIINTVREWGSALHLNEIVLGSNFIRYDGPGDFQLLLRSDLFENHGFDEDMLLGWHVDSNIAARMLLKYADVGDLGSQVYGYHCDHTRQVTPAHSHSRVQNDWKRFVTTVARSDIPLQAATWGCADDVIEEVRLASDPAQVYVRALRSAIGAPLATPNVVKYTGETYNKVDYDPRHLLPFLADMFASMPRTCNVGWYGVREETLRLFAEIWESLRFTGSILLDRPLLQQDHPTVIRYVSTAEVLAEADIFLIDFGGVAPSSNRSGAVDPVSGELRRSFRRVVREERRGLSIGKPPRRIIALNAINNEYEWFVCGFVAAAATPFATHMRHGFVLPVNAAWGDWVPLLSIGEAGLRVGDHIRSDPTKRGWLAYGPFKYLEQGQYLLSIEIEALADEPNRPELEPCVLIEVVAGPELLGVHLLRRRDLSATSHKFTFEVAQSVADGIATIETRIAVLSAIAIAIRTLTVEPASPSIELNGNAPAGITIPDLLRLDDWLPFLRIGPLGRADQSGVIAAIGVSAFVVYGPYWSLPAGRYEMIARFARNNDIAAPGNLIKADVAVGGGSVVAGSFYINELPYHEKSAANMLRLPFELQAPSSEQRLIETRIWSSGEQRLGILSVAVKILERQKQDVLFPSVLIGDTDNHAGGAILNYEKRIGFVGYEQTIALLPRTYRMALQVTVQMEGQIPIPTESTCLVVLVKQGSNILATTPIKSGAGQRETHELVFEVAGDASGTTGVEFLTRVATGAEVTLHNIIVEPVTAEFPLSDSAILEIEDWLPFLTTDPSASWEGDSLVVREGPAHYAIYGPYWTLPPGQYEMTALIVPPTPKPGGNPAITLDLVTDEGRQTLAACRWHLGHVQRGDSPPAIELRLPFRIAADATRESRTIETRIFTSGHASFHVRSLRVQVRNDGPDREWFPYFAVDECGIHTGDEIRTISGMSGYAARTPPIELTPGHYKATAKLTAKGPDAAGVSLEAWSGSYFLGIAGCDVGEFEFDAPEELARKGVELRIRSAQTGGATILGFEVEKISDAVAAHPALLRLDNWLPFLAVGPAGRRIGREVFAEPVGGFVVYGPYWRLPPGRYELSMLIKRQPAATDLEAQGVESGGEIIATLERELFPLIHADITCDGQQVAATDRIPFGAMFGSFANIRLFFEITGNGSVIETRVRTGGGTFAICSLNVKPIPSFEWLVRANTSAIIQKLGQQMWRMALKFRKKRS